VADLGAVEHNVGVLHRLAPASELWAVVKADGYGHGAVAVAGAALRAGAGGLCVALVQEAVQLREAGITAPILVLSEQPPEELAAAVRAGVIGTVYSVEQIGAWEAAGARDQAVHLKIDTGMRRVGAAPGDAVRVADAIVRSPQLRLDGVFTHLAVADEPEHPFTAEQLARYEAALAELADAGHSPPRVHAANSAGLIAHPGAHRSLVRAGIAIYGVAPGPDVAGAAPVAELRPVLSLHARIAHLKVVAAGERISYGLTHRFDVDARVATVPIGYADGLPRRAGARGVEVLVGGRRCPIVGTVTMDQVMVDVSNVPDAQVGDPVVLVGRQGDARITAEEVATRCGTIAYELLCGISPRIERRLLGAR
jgi:alanine racemase